MWEIKIFLSDLIFRAENNLLQSGRLVHSSNVPFSVRFALIGGIPILLLVVASLIL